MIYEIDRKKARIKPGDENKNLNFDQLGSGRKIEMNVDPSDVDVQKLEMELDEGREFKDVPEVELQNVGYLNKNLYKSDEEEKAPRSNDIETLQQEIEEDANNIEGYEI